MATSRWEPMSLKQLVLAVVAGGVVANVLDTIVHGF
jgi:lipoprotein signal peptidase